MGIIGNVTKKIQGAVASSDFNRNREFQKKLEEIKHKKRMDSAEKLADIRIKAELDAARSGKTPPQQQKGKVVLSTDRTQAKNKSKGGGQPPRDPFGFSDMGGRGGSPFGDLGAMAGFPSKKKVTNKKNKTTPSKKKVTNKKNKTTTKKTRKARGGTTIIIR